MKKRSWKSTTGKKIQSRGSENPTLGWKVDVGGLRLGKEKGIKFHVRAYLDMDDISGKEGRVFVPYFVVEEWIRLIKLEEGKVVTKEERNLF